MGMNSGTASGLGMSALKGGLTGLGQAAPQLGSRNPMQFNFSQLAQGFKNAQPKRPALGQGVTPNASGWNPFDPTNNMP